MPQTRVHSFPVVAEDFDITRAKVRGVSGTYSELQDLLVGGGVDSSSPMTGQISVVDSSAVMNRWLAGLMWNTSNDELISVESWGTGHVMNKGSMLVVRVSPDGGNSWRSLRSIYSDDDVAGDGFLRGAAFARLSNGRIAGVMAVGNTSRKLLAGVSTDSLATITWTDVTASLTVANPFIYGMMLPWPAAAGGSDTLGLMCASYAGTGDAKLLTSADGGATWSDRVLKTATGLPGQAQEPSLCWLADGKLLVLVRTSANTTVWGSVFSADLSTSTAWTDTGIQLGSNPVHVIRDGEWVYCYVMYRDGFTGSDEDNCLVEYSALSSAVSEEITALNANQRIVANLPHRGIGYPQSCRRILADGTEGDWFHTIVVGQDDSSTNNDCGAALALIRQRPGAEAGYGKPRSSHQLIECPTFSQWPRWTSKSGIASDEGGPGRYRISTSGATVNVSREAVPTQAWNAFPFRSVYGMRINNTGSANDFVGYNQRWLGLDAMQMAQRIAGRQLTSVIYGWSAFPTAWRISAAVTPIANEGTLVGGTAVSLGSAAFSIPQGITGAAPWVTSARLTTTALSDLGSIGLSPSNVSRVELSWNTWTSSIEFDLYMAANFVYVGPAPTEPELVTPAMDEAHTRRYVEARTATQYRPIAMGTAAAANVIWANLQYAPKVSTPTISGPATASTLQARGAVALAVSAVAYTGADEYGCRMTATVAGATVDGAYLLEFASTVDEKILIDTGA